MNASFVIVNYNRKNELLITITKTKDLIKNYKGQYEIVIVDNGSTDGSAEAVAATFPDVLLISKKDNIGAPAWNDGFAAAKGDYFIILDDDSHVESGLEEALMYIDGCKDIGVLALNVISGPYTSLDWNMQENKNIFGFIGCGAVFRRKTFEKTGGYADWIFLYANEWDLGLRSALAGYTVQYFHNCKVVHRTSSLHRTSKRLNILATKHELAIMYKYLPQKRWKYIFRGAFNKLKIIKGANLKNVWYVLLGIKQFLQIRTSLVYTPVSFEQQKQFIAVFPCTKKSVFNFVTKHFGKSEKSIKG